MDKALKRIRQKIETIRYGLLRFGKEEERQTMEVNASVNGDHLLDCIIINDNAGAVSAGGELNLIQKKDDDYLYITGLIKKKVRKTGKIISLRITKACWFTRKKRGNVIWLQQKYFYQIPEKQIKKTS